METIGYILAAITLVKLWELNRIDLLMFKVSDVQYSYKSKFFEWIGEHKPFNCETCLTLWAAFILFFSLDFQIFYLPLPLYYKFITKYL